MLEIVAELRRWRQAQDLPIKAIADGAGVDVSTVYRVFDENKIPLQWGSAIKAICKFANIQIVAAAAVGDIVELPQLLRDAMLQAWDGSDEHAASLASVIIHVGPLLRSRPQS